MRLCIPEIQRLKNGLTHADSGCIKSYCSRVISALYASDRRASLLSRLIIRQYASRVSGNIRPESAARTGTAVCWMHYADVCVCGVQECNYLPSRHTVALVSRTKPTAVARIASATASYATSDSASSAATTQHSTYQPPAVLFSGEQ